MERRSSPPEVELLEGGREEARRLPVGAPHVSRSYSDPYALVAWHATPVGVDIEHVGVLGDEFCDSICTPAERSLMRGAGAEEISSLWSSKEALAKALGDALDYDPRRLGSPMFWSNQTAGRWHSRRLELPAGYVGWVCWAD